MNGQRDFSKVEFLSIIAEMPDRTGPFLAGIGHIFPDKKTNWADINSTTPTAAIEAFFWELTKRDDIGVILITQYIANRIRRAVEAHGTNLPVVIEMPSKDHPWDPEKDTVYRRAREVMGA